MGPVHLRTPGGSEVVKVFAFDRGRRSALVIVHDPRCDASGGYSAVEEEATRLIPVDPTKRSDEVLEELAPVIIGTESELRRVQA